MNTNNQQGRNVSIIIGLYFIAKTVINLFLGGGILDIALAAVEAVALYTGLMYLNYVVAAIVAIVALVHLPSNLVHIIDNWFYLLEGVVDLICAAVLCLSPNVKEHFTNKWGGNA